MTVPGPSFVRVIYCVTWYFFSVGSGIIVIVGVGVIVTVGDVVDVVEVVVVVGGVVVVTVVVGVVGVTVVYVGGELGLVPVQLIASATKRKTNKTRYNFFMGVYTSLSGF